MSTPQLAIFDDQRGALGPMLDLRAVYDLRTGAVTTRHRIERAVGQPVSATISPDALTALTDAPTLADLNDGPVLLVNGRWTGITQPHVVRDLPYNASLIQSDGQLIAAHVNRDDVRHLMATRQWQAPANVNIQIAPEPMLIERPWHILDQLEKTLLDDLKASNVPIDNERGTRNPNVETRNPVQIANDADIAPMVVFDTARGPIVIDDGTQVHPFVSIEGPCYIGPNCVIGTHTSLRPNTVIGPQCKVSGEVAFSIFHSHSNKAHQGFVGHALIGQWCNLGADTNVSNLKNTYGPVRMQLSADTTPQNTGRTFLGPVLGDYVRTGIGTRLNTGAVVGTGAMIAHSGFSPKFVDRFTFLTDHVAQPYNMDKFINTARTVMARRDTEMSASLESRLRAMACDRHVLRDTGA